MDNNQDKFKKRKKKRFKAWKVVLLIIILAIFISAGAGAGVVLAYVKTAPEPDFSDFSKKLALTTNIYDKDGNYVESMHGVENRTYVPLSKIKKYTQDAFIAIEDERFEQHHGVDIKRIFGALLADLKSGSPEQGASTITQQLIKNTTKAKLKTLKRKIQEAYLAIELEKQLSKDEILEYYLNTIPLGGPAYGVQAAAEYYFNKNVDQLDIAESALIAGITQSPGKYNPYLNEKTPEVYKDRQEQVLSKMLELNMISQEEFDSAKNEQLHFSKKSENADLKYQWFIEAAIDSITNDLMNKYHYTNDEVNQMIYTGGLKIYTTIDPKLQEAAEKIADTEKYYPTLHDDIKIYGKDKIIQPQIGIVINDYKTGQIRAVVGGRGSQPLKSMNRATTIARQPGSSMKPIAVYGPAFDIGYSPASVIDDSPFTPELAAMAPDWPPEGPHNFVDNSYSGLTTIREAVRKSLNVVAAKLELKVGVNTSISYIKKFGITTLDSKRDTGPAIALGGLSEGVTPLEMSAAYGAFGNGGAYIQPILYTKVEDSEGNVILEKTQDEHQVISSQAAYLMIDVLKGVIKSGTGTRARSIGSMPAAGKTGTSENDENAYFAGLTPYYSCAIWMGHDKPSIAIIGGRKGNSSRTLSSGDTAQMWGDLMKEVDKGLKVVDFQKPNGIVSASVCKDSGLLPTELCQNDPRGSRVITDMFIQGKVPTGTCSTHVTALIDSSNGKLANEFCPPSLVVERVFIKKLEPTSNKVADSKYQVPITVCDVHTTPYNPTPTPTVTPTPPDTTPTGTPTPTLTDTPTPPDKPKHN